MLNACHAVNTLVSNLANASRRAGPEEEEGAEGGGGQEVGRSKGGRTQFNTPPTAQVVAKGRIQQ
jgi:hypothetical protein